MATFDRPAVPCSYDNFNSCGTSHAAQLPAAAELRRAFDEKDASYDGVFFVAVRTTGIFCKPSCSARPLAKNVEFYATAGEALFAGYRPCKRCRPLDAGGAHPKWAEGLLTEIAADPAARIGDGDLRRRGLAPATVRRYFLRRFGVTFGVCTVDSEGPWSDSGPASHSMVWPPTMGTTRLAVFGRRSGNFSAGRQATAERPISFVWRGSKAPSARSSPGRRRPGICLLEFTTRRMLEAQLSTLRRRFGVPLAPGDNKHLAALRSELAGYFAGMLRSFSVPIVMPGTPFQENVWNGLRQIPYGAKWSYERLAAAVGRPGAARAVGRANGLNRIAILVPCHRVVMKDGRPLRLRRRPVAESADCSTSKPPPSPVVIMPRKTMSWVEATQCRVGSCWR